MKIFLILNLILISVTNTVFAENSQKNSDSMSYEELLTYRFSDTFQRKNDVLTLHYDNQKSKEFKDIFLNTEAMKKFEIIKYIGSQSIIVLQETHYEAIQYTLISLKNGHETPLIGLPKWNEAETRFASLESNGTAYQAGYCIKEDCKLLPKTKGRFSNVYWSKDDELIVEKIASTSCKFKKFKLICN